VGCGRGLSSGWQADSTNPAAKDKETAEKADFINRTI
jgi:hypothetical protein